jgi:hypothetical protein
VAVLGALALVLGVGAAPTPAGALDGAAGTAADAAQRARFEAAWAAQDPGDPLTRVTSPLPGI